MHICLKNSPAKFQSSPIWNDAALGLFAASRPQQHQEQQQDDE